MPVRSRRRPRTRKKTKRKGFRSRHKVATRRRARKKTKRRMKGGAGMLERGDTNAERVLAAVKKTGGGTQVSRYNFAG